MPDQALPDLIGRALMHNAAAVMELASVTEKLRTLENVHADLKEEHEALNRLRIEYDNYIEDLQHKMRNNERDLEHVQKECFEKVDSATELAEKQNALTMTLEAKVKKGFIDQFNKSCDVFLLYS